MGKVRSLGNSSPYQHISNAVYGNLAAEFYPRLQDYFITSIHFSINSDQLHYHPNPTPTLSARLFGHMSRQGFNKGWESQGWNLCRWFHKEKFFIEWRTWWKTVSMLFIQGFFQIWYKTDRYRRFSLLTSKITFWK